MAMPSSLGVVAGLGESVHPRLEQLDRGESRQAPDRAVDLPPGRPAFCPAEQVAGQEGQLLPRLNAASHGSQEAIHQEASRPRRPGTPEADLCLAVVEEEVPRLVKSDAIQERS